MPRHGNATLPYISETSDAPLFGWRGVPLAALLALILCWPMLVTGQIFVFQDTPSYLRGGEVIWGVVSDRLTDVLATPTPSTHRGGGEDGTRSALTVNDRGQPVTGRSFTYSTAAYLAHTVGGPLAIAWAQGFVTVFMAFALVGRGTLARPGLMTAGFLVVALLTTWPWYTVYLIPDGLAAVVVMFGMVLAGRLEALSRAQIGVATALAAIAVSTHYGYMPLVLSVVMVALGCRLAASSLRPAMVMVALVPVLAAPLANLGASGAVLEEASVAPRRLPILLARSIQDGPARWYLLDACPEADLTFCEAFGEKVPESIGAFLWAEDGVGALTPEQMNGIRAEEATILTRAFLAYPVEQTASLLGNWGQQIIRIGTRDISAAGKLGSDWQWNKAGPDTSGARMLRLADVPVAVAAWTGGVVILVLTLGGWLDRRQAGMVVALAAGLLANAAIFGGLSAPVERYQSRLAWLMPILAVVLLCDLAGRWRDNAGQTEAGRTKVCK